jgi:hypothetical protein
MINNISIVTPIAYDFLYSFKTISTYYRIADEIILGIDSDRISWSHKKYEFNEELFRDSIKKIDVENKIKIVQDNFHFNNAPAANDTYERNYLSTKCKEGSWILQIDSDECLLNPDDFILWVQTVNPNYGFKAKWTTVFKSFDKYALVLSEKGIVQIGTKLKNSYTIMRNTAQPTLISPLNILHYSWGRTDKEVWQKLTNWSHSQDFDIKKFYDVWKNLTLDNYKELRDFHPLYGPDWKELQLVELENNIQN